MAYAVKAGILASVASIFGRLSLNSEDVLHVCIRVNNHLDHIDLMCHVVSILSLIGTLIFEL